MTDSTHEEALDRALRESAERMNLEVRDWEDLNPAGSEIDTIYRFQTLVEGEPDPQLRLTVEALQDEAAKSYRWITLQVTFEGSDCTWRVTDGADLDVSDYFSTEPGPSAPSR